MHLQIRKKEKYLLFSMVCYLLIISSALFLIFTPVNGWSLINQYNISNSGTNVYTVQTVYFNTLQSIQNNVTWMHWEGYGRIFGTYAASGSMSVDFIDSVDSSDCGDGTFQWSSDKTSVVYSSLDIYVTSFDASDCHNPIQLKSGSTDILDNTHLRFAAYKGPGTGIPAVNAFDLIQESSVPRYGNFWVYGGSDVPDAPVITNFTVEKSCYNPNESVILHADVTGTVDTWNWKVYDLEGNVISETSDPVDTVTDPLNVIGSLAAKVTVTNGGGTDDDYRTGFINVTQPGTCNFTPYNPFPTVTATPTQNVFVTMTMPPSVLVNLTGVNDIINNSYLGNMSAGYRSYIDQIGEGANTTFVGVVTIVQSPLTMVVNGIAEGVSLFSVSINSLMSYTTIPLAIVGITLSYYPWQIITLITAGIAIDAAFVLIFGVR